MSNAPTQVTAPHCPVKDLAITVQHLMDAHKATDLAIIGRNKANPSHEEMVSKNQLQQRFDALTDLIASKRDHALTMTALSADGALHQVALTSFYAAELAEFLPDYADDAAGWRRSRHLLRMMDFGLYSVAAVLERLSVEPRTHLAVENYMPMRLSPLAASAVAMAGASATFDPEQRLSDLNNLMVRVRTTRAAAWAREETVEGDEQTECELIASRCDREITDITEEAATIVPHSVRGFALKARLLTCIHGSEETNFTTEEDTLYRSLIGQLLAAAGLSRIDDGADDAKDFLDRSDAKLARAA